MKDNGTILAVDDSPESLALLVTLLTGAGYRALAADSGELALAAVAANPPDLILLDIRMKGMDGFEVCRQLKAGEATRAIPIILISAFADAKEWVKGLQLGAADYITKPFQPDELLTRVKTHLALGAATASLEQSARALRQSNEQLQSEIAVRRRTEEELRQSLDLAERSGDAILLALEKQKATEAALRESEQKYRILFDEMTGGYAVHQVVYDESGRPVDFCWIAVNAAYENMTGLHSAQILGKTVLEILPAIEPSWIEHCAQVALTRAPVQFVNHAGALEKYFEVRAFSPEPGLIATLFDDITTRKRAEDLLRARLELVEFSASHAWEEILQRTLDEVGELTGSPIGFFYFVDGDQETLSLQTWSTRTVQEFCQAEGKGMRYPISQAGIWADCVHTKAPVIHNDYASEPGRKGLPEGHAVVLRELVVPILRSGQTVAILGVGNKPTGYTQEDVDLVSFLADVAWESAKRKQAEEALRSYSEHLQTEVDRQTRELCEAHERLVRQERLATLGQLAGSIGHELRNPLGVMANAVYFLTHTQPDLHEEVIEYLAILESEIRTSEKIISDLLDVSRVTAADRKRIAVPELVERVLERYPAPPSVSVSLDFATDLPPACADPAHLAQVLGNLVTNACQAMEAGGTLVVSGRRSTLDGRPFVAISVQDTGVGIPPENIGKLFEPLFTTKARGIGLGLSVCANLVMANGGRIEVQSELGRGATFTVLLPAYVEAA